MELRYDNARNIGVAVAWHDVTLTQAWRSDDATLTQTWRSDDATLTQQWRDDDVTVTRQWRSSGVTLTQQWRGDGVARLGRLDASLSRIRCVSMRQYYRGFQQRGSI